MSKTRSIEFETFDVFKCSVENIAALLEKAGWSFIDCFGKVNIYNINDDDEWGVFGGTYDEFLHWHCMLRLIGIYRSDGQTAELYIKDDHHFTIFPSSYIKMVDSNNGSFFDFNWYYDNFVNNFNKGQCVIERVIFEEYY